MVSVFFAYAWYSLVVAKRTPKQKSILHISAHTLLSNAGIVVAGTLIVVSFILTVYIASPSLITGQLASVVSSRLVSLTNEDRSETGLGTLTVNPVLVAAAQAKADDMASKGYFAHVSPDGRNSWTWFKDSGYAFSYAGENLAVDFTDSGDVNEAWLNSPTHRANIMNGHFTQIGIATAQGEYQGRKTTFVVQMFGTPAVAKQSVVTSSSLPENPKVVAVAETKPVSEVLGTSAGPSKATIQKPSTIAKSDSAPSATEVASSAPAQLEVPADSSVVASIASSPRNFLRDVYIIFAVLLLSALIFRTRMEFKLHHMRHVFAVMVLIIGMSGLFVAADHFIFIPPVIGEGVSQ